jgi:uncharacterized FlgJ-related protein
MKNGTNCYYRQHKQIISGIDSMKDSLEKAVTSLNSASDNLREALREGSEVESIVLLPLIKNVNETLISVEYFLNAKRNENNS